MCPVIISIWPSCGVVVHPHWKGTPQDCVDHIIQKHLVPSSIKAANSGWLFTDTEDSVTGGVRYTLQHSTTGFGRWVPALQDLSGGIPGCVGSVSWYHVINRRFHQSRYMLPGAAASSDLPVLRPRSLLSSWTTQLHCEQSGLQSSARTLSKKEIVDHCVSPDRLQTEISATSPDTRGVLWLYMFDAITR